MILSSTAAPCPPATTFARVAIPICRPSSARGSRWTTCESSCPSTAAISSADCNSRIRPLSTQMTRPGSVKALISGELMTSTSTVILRSSTAEAGIAGSNLPRIAEKALLTSRSSTTAAVARICSFMIGPRASSSVCGISRDAARPGNRSRCAANAARARRRMTAHITPSSRARRLTLLKSPPEACSPTASDHDASRHSGRNTGRSRIDRSAESR